MTNDGSVGDPRLRVTLSGPGGSRQTLGVSSIIDCTGPGPDPSLGSPLVARLMADGLARLHPSGIGLDVDQHGRTPDGVGSTGDRSTRWVGAGKGAEFEATAVPEIRRQADRLARHLVTTAGRIPDLVPV